METVRCRHAECGGKARVGQYELAKSNIRPIVCRDCMPPYGCKDRSLCILCGNYMDRCKANCDICNVNVWVLGDKKICSVCRPSEGLNLPEHEDEAVFTSDAASSRFSGTTTELVSSSDVEDTEDEDADLTWEPTRDEHSH